MSSKLANIQQEYFRMLENIPFVEEDLDYGVLDSHTPHLESLDRIGNSAISVFDMYRKTHVYTSPSYRERLGLPDDKKIGPEGFDRLMHPDDLLTAMKAGYYFLKMAISMKTDRLYNFKLINDFRIETPGKKWMRMTEQHQILETDPYGNIWLSLSIVDVSANQNINEPMSSRLVNHKTGKIIPYSKVTSFFTLTNREKEILQLISEGNVSKQIANELHISIHTVNTHRQNIIEKMNVTNTAEAIRLAGKMGLF